MKRRTPFRLIALFAVVAAFALTVMPAWAWADPFGGWEYTERTSGTKIEIGSSTITSPANPQTVNVVVNVDGVTVHEDTVTNVPRAGSYLDVDLADGYDIRTETSGDLSLTGSDDEAIYWSFNFTELQGEGTVVINLLSNRIDTEWGTISYTNATASGYNLTVRLHVNGELKYTTPKLRVAGSEPLKVDPSEGLYFNATDFGAHPWYAFHDGGTNVGTWDYTVGTLTFSATSDEVRDHNNYLDVYLCTFDDFVYLNVTRDGLETEGKVIGYYVEYDIDDQHYKYRVNEFGDFASEGYKQIIPRNADVTLTAICKDGWEVTEWRLADPASNDIESRGNSAVVNSHYQKGATVEVVVSHVCPMPEKPTFEEVEDIFGNELVTVDCVNTTIDPEHEDKTYGPIAGGVEIGDVVNNNGTYNVTLTVTAPTYVGKYSSDVQVAHMLADGAADTHEVVLTYKDGKWYKADDFSPEVFKVMCSEVQDPKPELPTESELAKLTGAQVTVTCVTENSGHDSEKYAPIAGAYSFPKGVEGDAEQGYTATMVVNAAAYVDKFSTAERGEHVLAADEQDTKSVVLKYVIADDGQGSWELADDAAPINFNVECVVETEPEPEGPDTPGKDELDKLFGDQFVTIDCVNDNASHVDKSYGLVDGAYTVHHEKDAATATVVISPHAYVNKYENEADINKAHELVSGLPESTTFNLKYENYAWAIDGADTVTYQVACVDEAPVVPDQPTFEEILEATPQGAVTIDCTNAAVEHENKTYGIEKGAYTLGAVNDADGDGVYTVDVQVSAGSYVLKFEADHEGIHHYLVPEQGAKTITLAYDDATDSWNVADGSASPVTFTVLCDVEDTTDPDTPGDGGDEPGTNPDDKPGDGSQGNKPGDGSQGNGEDQGKGDNNANGNQGANGNAGTASGEGKLTQTGDVATLLAAAVAGAGALAVGAGYAAKRRK